MGRFGLSYGFYRLPGSSTVDGQSYVCTWVFWVLLFRLNERAEMHFADLLGPLAEFILGPQGSYK